MLTDCLTISMTKTAFWWQKLFCHPSFFSMEKGFSTNRQKPTNPDSFTNWMSKYQFLVWQKCTYGNVIFSKFLYRHYNRASYYSSGQWCKCSSSRGEGDWVNEMCVLMYCQVDCAMPHVSQTDRSTAGAEDQKCARQVIARFLLYFYYFWNIRSIDGSFDAG